MAAARGPLAVASHLMGITEFLMVTQVEADDCLKLIDKTTMLCIDWLKAQLSRMGKPLGVLVLDDVVGMISPKDAERFAFPFLKRIFDAFPDLIHIYHNDTPNKNVYEGLKGIGMDVFNLTHEVELEEARSLLGPDVVIMGNLPPLDLLVRGKPKEVKYATEDFLVKAEKFGPVLVSPGGGVSPGTPVDNLKAMLEVVEGR
jgi:uroporphyrinogen decarboxylase